VVRLTDVAARAGVSLATASRVVNGSTRAVGAEISEHVLAVAADLGYLPNANAQAIARGTSKLIGLIVNDIADPYFSVIASGAMRVAEQHGMLLLGSTHNRPEQELAYVAMLRAQRAQALILVGSRTTDTAHEKRLTAEVAAFRAAGGRVAAISQNKLGADTVLVENRSGARALARALFAAGHRRFAVFAGPPGLLTARDRARGFADGLTAEGIAPVAYLNGAFTRDGGYAAAEQLLSHGDLPDCVFVAADVMALGAIAAFRDNGVRVPHDVGVAGFDDITTLRDVTPSLTTVRLPLLDMGQLVCEMALDQRAGDKPRVVRVQGEVVIRESTARNRVRK
jgi:LacI family transcriptional regulator